MLKEYGYHVKRKFFIKGFLLRITPYNSATKSGYEIIIDENNKNKKIFISTAPKSLLSKNTVCYCIEDNKGDNDTALLLPLDFITKESFITFFEQGYVSSIGKKPISLLKKEELQFFLDVFFDDIAIKKDYLDKNYSKMITQWNEAKKYFLIHVLLYKHDISSFVVKRIYKFISDNTVIQITTNPYVLMGQEKIGFKTADKIAAEFGIITNDKRRVAAAILWILMEKRATGNTIIEYMTLLSHARNTINNESTKSEIEEVCNILIKRNKISIIKTKTYEWCSMAHDFAVEKEIYLLLQDVAMHNDDKKKYVYDACIDSKLTDQQKLAVENSHNYYCSILTGGPGTGKTTTIKAIYSSHAEQGRKCVLLAPTGRAARRIEESVGVKAFTLHHCLGFKRIFQSTTELLSHPYAIFFDVVIVDESSMIDIYMMYTLLKSLKKNTRIVFVGDHKQLPSIGCGNVLHDMLHMSFISKITLTNIFRQSITSNISVISDSIINGIFPSLPDTNDYECYFVARKTKEESVEYIKNIAKEWHSGDNNFNLQFICPMHRGSMGTHNINITIQNLNANFNGIAESDYKSIGYRFNLYDKVIQTVNNYDLDVCNGEIGKIIEGSSKECAVNFGDKIVHYKKGAMMELQLAYAISVHKAQGSEFDAICIPLQMEHFVMLGCNILYTAITRAKKHCILLGEKRALMMAIKKKDEKIRQTALYDIFSYNQQNDIIMVEQI